MNKGFPSIKTWFLTHHVSTWAEGVLVALFLTLAASILWESP